MFSFKEQIEWLENKLEHIDNVIEKEDDKVVKKSLKDDRNMIFLIISGYKKANNDSISLSWTENPDRMGQ